MFLITATLFYSLGYFLGGFLVWKLIRKYRANDGLNPDPFAKDGPDFDEVVKYIEGCKVDPNKRKSIYALAGMSESSQKYYDKGQNDGLDRAIAVIREFNPSIKGKE